jgi:phosphomannomutase
LFSSELSRLFSSSNTEPIMRIIAEAPDRATAEQKIAQVRAVVDRILR